MTAYSRASGNGMEALGTLVSIVAIVALGFFTTGLCLSILWGWFVVPLGVIPIGGWHAIGLSTMISVALGSRGVKTDTSEKPLPRLFGWSVVFPIACLAIGALAHWGMS